MSATTASLFILAIRGGRSVGDMATGLSVSGLGIRWALFLNGVFAVLIEVGLARAWQARTGCLAGPSTDPATQRQD